MAANTYELPPGFSERLRQLREAAYMTQGDLAERAGVAARSVHEIESGRRERVLAKTVMLLAEALEMKVEDLLADGAEIGAAGVAERTPRSPWRGVLIGAVVAVSAALALWFCLPAVAPALSGRNVVVDQEAGSITTRDELLGETVWERNFGDRVLCWRYAPWSDETLLVGLDDRCERGGRLIALDVRSGEELWSFAPNRGRIAEVFGPASVESGGFDCNQILDADLGGDGKRELVVQFTHEFWYPDGIWILDDAGRLQSSYLNRGHLYGIRVHDLDDDGRDEIVCAGTNNAPENNGPTLFILDDTHRTGAAGAAVADSSLVRIVLPNWPVVALDALDPGCRTEAANIGVFRDGDQLRISTTVGSRAVGMSVLTLDRELRPLAIGAGDMLRVACREADIDLTVLGREWLDAHTRYEQGVRVETPRLPAVD
jgi:DNA-binding XRE family transcriptional regulator